MAQTQPELAPGAIRVIMCTLAWREKLLDYALSVAQKLDFDGVEIWGREPHVPERFDENRLRATRKQLEATHLTPYALGSYLRLGATRNDHSAVQLGDTLHIARWLKTPLVRVWVSDVPSRSASETVWSQAVAEAQQASERAAKLDLMLVAEMHAGTLADTAEAAAHLVQAVDRPNFRLNYQIASVRDGQTPEQRLETVLPWVAHVHAQNFEQLAAHEADPVRRVPLSVGVASYPRLVGMLRDVGYQGCVAVEFAFDETGDKRAALREDLAFLKSLCRPPQEAP
jgi:sugar phosphate isomerase/epimerase